MGHQDKEIQSLEQPQPQDMEASVRRHREGYDTGRRVQRRSRRSRRSRSRSRSNRDSPSRFNNTRNVSPRRSTSRQIVTIADDDNEDDDVIDYHSAQSGPAFVSSPHSLTLTRSSPSQERNSRKSPTKVNIHAIHVSEPYEKIGMKVARNMMITKISQASKFATRRTSTW